MQCLPTIESSDILATHFSDVVVARIIEARDLTAAKYTKCKKKENKTKQKETN